MKNQAKFFKGLADETRLKILWLLMQKEELCVCDIMAVLHITQSKASRHLRYLYNLGLVSDRREGVWMNYRITVAPGSMADRQLNLLAEMFSNHSEAQGLKTRLKEWIEDKTLPSLKAAGMAGELGCSCK